MVSMTTPHNDPFKSNQPYNPFSTPDAMPQPANPLAPQTGFPAGSPVGYQHPALPPAYVVSVAPKSKVLAAVLAFFFGSLGIHNFYLGYNGRGAVQLTLFVIGLITSLLLIGFFITAAVGLWAFVEFIMILIGAGQYTTDARGVLLD